MFTKIDLMLGHKRDLDKFKKTKIIERLITKELWFSDHKRIELEINSTRNLG